jgi:hypothetical protein
MKRLVFLFETVLILAISCGILAALWLLDIFDTERAPSPHARDVDDLDHVEKLLASVWEPC